MVESVPLRLRPLTVTDLAVPTVGVAKAPVALLVFRVTESPLTTPTRLALPKLSAR